MLKGVISAATIVMLSLPGQAATLNPDKAVSVTNFGSVTPRVALDRTRTGDFYRHALFFDLSGLTGNVTGATLRFLDGLGTQVSIGTSRTYNVWDVTTDLDTVTATLVSPAVAQYYSDLSGGVLYGTTTFGIQPTNGANPLPSPGFEVDLANGLTAINQALGSRIGFGGQSSQTFYIFSGAADLSKIELDLEIAAAVPPNVVPVPAGGLFLLTGLGGIAALKRRKKGAV